jgi:hypothetical protein
VGGASFRVDEIRLVNAPASPTPTQPPAATATTAAPTKTPTAVAASPTAPAATATSPAATATSAAPTATRTPTTPAATATRTPTTPAAPTASPTRTTVPPTAQPNGFVGRSGTQFTLNGQPFRFVGFNLHDAAATVTNWDCNGWGLWSDAEMETTLRTLHDQGGVTVLRFWAYQSYTKGGTDFSSFDRLIAVAKKTNVKLMPVLDDQWFYCSNGPSKPQNWFSTGYKAPWGTNPLSYREYAQRVVTRYKNEPAIFAWSLMNEPDPIAIDWDTPVWADRNQATTIFRAWVTDMSTLVKSLDPNHLLTIGTVAESWQDYLDFVGNHALPTIDFSEVHEYGKDNEAMPARVSQRLAESLTQVGKPIIIGEAGIEAGSGTPVTLAQRASLLDAKMNAFFNAGGAGYLVWNVSKPGSEAYRVQLGDPLIPLMKKYAKP